MKKVFAKVFLAVLIFFLGWYSSTIISSSNTPKVLLKNTPTLLEQIKAKQTLDVVILNSPTVYYIGANRKLGFEYELIRAFAKDINVSLNLHVVSTIDKALELSREGFGDITVAGLSITPERKKEFDFGPYYFSVQEQLICNSKLYRTGEFPQDFLDLEKLSIVVGKNTSYEQTLKNIQKEYPNFSFTTTLDKSTAELIKNVHLGKIDCTVADSNIFSINQRYYPNSSRAFALSEQKNLAWILRKGDNSLNDVLFTWLNNYEYSGKMAQLKDFYYSYLNIFDYYDNKIFTKRLKKRLPKYIKYFKEAGKKYKIPWELLAAQSYQESHWNPRAKSYTGVRGMMMLTLTTAKQMGIKNRLNAKQSILGGAKYLQKLEDRLSDDIVGKNRYAIALAAYNVGMGHIHDAQTLARKLNKNPNSWKDLKEILPLLSQAKYYKKLKYGYARGNEPVAYVNSIQNYMDIILKEYP